MYVRWYDAAAAVGIVCARRVQHQKSSSRASIGSSGTDMRGGEGIQNSVDVEVVAVGDECVSVERSSGSLPSWRGGMVGGNRL